MGLTRSMLLKASESAWLAKHLPRFAFSRRAVRRFMPGEDLADALAECAVLAGTGAASVITRLGENITSLKEADAVTAHYVEALTDIERRALPTHLSIKLTQLGLDVDANHATACTTLIARHSARLGTPVWIDMEGSRYTETTIAAFRKVRAAHANVGLCLQAYLHRTGQDLQDLLHHTTAIRLVKGAYNESAEVAIQDKQDVDRNYLACADLMLEAARSQPMGHAPAFATHDPALIKNIIARAQRMGVPRENFEFQLLYGINRAEQQRIAREGYRLRVLISYGSAWFAWYMRRLAERPANVWMILRESVRA